MCVRCLRTASVNPRGRQRCELEIGYRDNAIAVSSAKLDESLSYVNSVINASAWVVSVYMYPGREITPEGDIVFSFECDFTSRDNAWEQCLLGSKTFLIWFDFERAEDLTVN